MIVESSLEAELNWSCNEFRTISLGDKRLDWRVKYTAARLSARPNCSINQACEEWADTKAAYRLFDNDKTTSDKILQPHIERTRERAADYERVLAIQDTSFLDYSHHPTKEGLGPIGTTAQSNLRGLVMHTTLMTTPEGLPLGIATQEVWHRDESARQLTADERRKLPIEEKESFKWITAMTHTCQQMDAGLDIVTVGDSEADIFELFDHARRLETNLLIRAGQNRALCEPEVGLLHTTLLTQESAGTLTVAVPARKEQPKRTAHLTVRHCPVTLKPPRHLKNLLAPIPLYAILVVEESPPDGVSPLRWLLLTTVPVGSLDDALERIKWYCCRWQIEVYHKTLKSGCRVEETQLATAERLFPFLALSAVIAWRIFWLTSLARHEPDSPCTCVLAPHEWQALYTYHHKQEPDPEHLPTVLDALLWIAQLGGFLGRRHDGFPGVTVIWRGWQRLADISSSWLIFHPNDTYG